MSSSTTPTEFDKELSRILDDGAPATEEGITYQIKQALEKYVIGEPESNPQGMGGRAAGKTSRVIRNMHRAEQRQSLWGTSK